MPGYFTRPNGVSNPPVVLVAMEIFGLHEYIKDVTRRLAKLGAFAVAPDYYFRKGTDLTRITDIPRLLPIVSSKPDAKLFSDLDSTVAWAKSQGGDTSRLGIVGFCRGGRNVWEYAAHNSALKAAVAFYGPPVDPPNPLWPKSPTQLAPEMKAPVLGLYGEADTGIPVAQVEALKAALAQANKTAEFKIYPGAPHGSTPTIVQAIARKPPRTHGARCRPGSGSTRCSADRTPSSMAGGATVAARLLIFGRRGAGPGRLEEKKPVSLSDAIAVATRF
jgi:carboxymethylenebutenolidase